MEYQLNLRPVEKVVAVEDKCTLVIEACPARSESSVDQRCTMEGCFMSPLRPKGLRRGVQPSEQRPRGPPVPQTLPGPGPEPGPRPGPGQTAVMVNSKGPPLSPLENRSLSASSSPLSYSSSELDSLSSQQTEVGVDCAGVVLYCLFCRFYDLLVMLPASCERAADRCCPAYKHVASRACRGAAEAEGSGPDWDCGLLDSCQDTTDCLELALDMSELCYR